MWIYASISLIFSWPSRSETSYSNTDREMWFIRPYSTRHEFNEQKVPQRSGCTAVERAANESWLNFLSYANVNLVTRLPLSRVDGRFNCTVHFIRDSLFKINNAGFVKREAGEAFVITRPWPVDIISSRRRGSGDSFARDMCIAGATQRKYYDDTSPSPVNY